MEVTKESESNTQGESLIAKPIGPVDPRQKEQLKEDVVEVTKDDDSNTKRESLIAPPSMVDRPDEEQLDADVVGVMGEQEKDGEADAAAKKEKKEKGFPGARLLLGRKKGWRSKKAVNAH